MMSAIAAWMFRKWMPRMDDAVIQFYPMAFGTEPGRVVLQHLIDTVYCTIYEGTDPIGLAHHNGQRSVIQAILENIDRAKEPMKYKVTVTEGAPNGRVV